MEQNSAVEGPLERQVRPPRRIRVEVKNAILGDSVFWEGDVLDIHKIHNIPARRTAAQVAIDGKPRACGMWHVSAA